ncbi:hypothetical protein OAV43_04365, partial [Pseudomonadales bacterium]|nr:hypothetical protein [Pseudomonadales bacterium]
KSIVPSQRLQYRPRSGGTGVRVCSSTPPGIYSDTFIALDGRGGSEAYHYTVEVAIEKTETGSAAWFPAQAEAPSDQLVFDQLNLGLAAHLTLDGTRINSAPVENFDVTYSANFDGSTTFVQGPLGQGVTGQVVIPSGNVPNQLREGAYSIAYWARLGPEASCGGSSQQSVLLQYGDASGGIVFQADCIQNNGGLDYTGSVVGLNQAQLPSDYQWHHYTLTVDDDNNAKLYIDGVKGSEGVAPARTISENNNLILGSATGDCDCAFDDFRIYERSLGSVDVYNLYRLGSGSAEVGLQPEVIGTCSSNYCSENANSIFYVYRLTDELEPFIFDPLHKREPIKYWGGLVGGSFNYSTDLKPFKTTDSQLDSQEADFTDYLMASTGNLLLKGGDPLGNSLRSQNANGEKFLEFHLTNWSGALIKPEMTQASFGAVITRPEVSAGIYGGNCQRFLADQVFTGLVPSGGAIMMTFDYGDVSVAHPPNSTDATSFVVCDDTTPGEYPMVLEALDGRGGKLKADFTLSVTNTNEGSGSIVWNTSTGDRDNDGVPDDIDAFPNDPAASVDTDGDGLPDRWNIGAFAEDSTSTPALIKDMDDDGDGVLDSVDQRPLDASEAFDFDGDGIGDNADTDDDDDGYNDAVDAFSLNPFDWTDTDNDGVGDNTDAFGLDENQQSLLVAEAVSKVLD